MLVVESTMDEMAPHRRAASPVPRTAAEAGTVDPVEIADLLALLQEDVRLGIGQLATDLARLAGDATALREAVLGLDGAGHTLAAHAAGQIAALPRLGMLRRLLDRQVAAVDTVLAADDDTATMAAAADEARQSSRVLAHTLMELEAAFAPQPAQTEALARVVEVGTLRLGLEPGAERCLGERLAAMRDRLRRFEARLLLALRLPGAPERRREPRLPLRLRVRLQCGDRVWQGATVDLARGGALVGLETSFERPRIGGCAKVELDGLGSFPARIVGSSARGVHLAFDRPAPVLQAALDSRLAAVAALDAPFFQLARWAAREVEASFARGVAAGEISEAALFASPAVLLLGASEPAATAASTTDAATARDFLARRLAPLQAQIAAGRPELVYATCSDRHGYLAVVTGGPAAACDAAAGTRTTMPLFALSGELDESYDGMSAARARHERLAHAPVPGAYEVAVPITVEGRHWGAFRIGFRRPGE